LYQFLQKISKWQFVRVFRISSAVFLDSVGLLEACRQEVLKA
jgi:hypothetical protein